MEPVRARSLGGSLVVAAVALALAAASASAFSIDGVDVAVGSPSNGGPLPASGAAAAGAHPDMAIAIAFGGGADSVRALSIDLAPGIVAQLGHVPVCASWDATTQTRTDCPDSVVGAAVTDVTATAAVPILPWIPAAGEVPLTLSGTIYRIPSPAPGRVPAAFGIDIDPPLPLLSRVKLVSPISVDPSDLGLVARLDGLPDEASGLPLRIDRITQTLFGYTAAGRSFFTNPTACIAAPVAVTATSHAGATAAGSGGYTPTDCAGVPFSTSLTVRADPSTADSTAAISFDVRPGAADVPRANGHVARTTVVAPPGVLLNPALAARLDACTDAQFAQADTAVAAACPPSSAVGSIRFVSPILGPFPGTAYFGTSTPTDRLRLFLDVPLLGAHIKVAATVNPDRATGQVTTVFTTLPQIAFTDFELTFRGGAQSALVTPATCGEHVARAVVTPWSGGPPSTPTGSFATTGCERRFAPSVAASVSDARAGAAPAFALAVERPDRSVPIARMRLALPAGLVGRLSLPGLTRCSELQAAARDCPPSSRIGSVAAVVGSGAAPPTLAGEVFLGPPRVLGDPGSLSIQVPARLGPVDAGVVTVGARLALRGDGGLDVISDAIPALQEGIPLALRRLAVTIDRAGFMRNPTRCGSQTVAGAFDALDGGPGATATATFAIDGCARLRFAPRIAATLGRRGKTRLRSHPPLRTVVRLGAHDAALRVVRVRLPRALATNVKALDAACDEAALAAGRCGRRARAGTATAVSPLLSAPLRGPAYLVKQARGLPQLVVRLRGEVALDVRGKVTVGRRGALATAFAPLPDLPVSRFDLRLRGGPLGVLDVVEPICRRRRLVLPTRFAGQSGARAGQRARIAVKGCAKATRRHGPRADRGTRR